MNSIQNPRDNANPNEIASPRWDVSQERMFLENLLGQRFNFFLVFFALVLAGALNSKGWPSWVLTSILGLGTIICALLSLIISRSQQKLDVILEHIFRNDPRHPASFADIVAGPGSVRKLIGYVIPRFCIFALGFAAILSALGVLVPPHG